VPARGARQSTLANLSVMIVDFDASQLPYLRGIGALIRLQSTSYDYAVTSKLALDDLIVVGGHVCAVLHAKVCETTFESTELQKYSNR
jgi:hypothetical protein